MAEDLLEDLMATMERRERLHQRVVDGLAHYERAQAIGMILSWFSLDELEHRVIPVLAPEFKS